VKKGSTTHFTTVDAIQVRSLIFIPEFRSLFTVFVTLQAAVYADGSVSASFNV
jgi:hypothetical protein